MSKYFNAYHKSFMHILIHNNNNLKIQYISGLKYYFILN